METYTEKNKNKML